MEKYRGLKLWLLFGVIFTMVRFFVGFENVVIILLCGIAADICIIIEDSKK